MFNKIGYWMIFAGLADPAFAGMTGEIKHNLIRAMVLWG
jgi:hypothetical protein